MAYNPESHFRDWLRRVPLTGCAFAAQFGARGEGLLFYEVMGDIRDVDADDVAAFFDRAASDLRVAILLAPQAKGDDATAILLRVLADHPRWDISAAGELARDDAEIGVRMTWRTRAGQTTDAMGFAPSTYMPLTRRAPHLGLAAWTGGHENPKRKRHEPGHVIIGDAPPPELGTYSATMERTRESSRRLTAPDEIEREHLRRLAFRLDRRAVEHEFPALLATSGR